MAVLTNNSTGAAALATTITFTTGQALDEVRLHLSANGGSAENFTITLDALAGSAYDVLLFSQDMNTTADVIYRPDRPAEFVNGDKLVFAYNNGNTRTWGLEIKLLARQ